MSAPSVNRAGIEAGRAPRPPARPAVSAPPVDAPPASPVDAARRGTGPAIGGLRLTRRRLIGLAAGAAGAAPAVQAVATAVGPPPFDVALERGRVVVRVGGAVRWVLAGAPYAGRPRLDVARTADAITITLADARFAGTSIPADLVARFTRGALEWRVKLNMPGLAFATEGDALGWLAGTPLAGPARIRSADLGFGAGDGLHLPHAWRAAYSVDASAGTLRLTATGERAVLSLAGQRLAARAVTWTVPSPDAPSLHARPSAVRTVLTLHRENARWAWRPVLDLPDGAEWTWSAAPFDTVHVEMAERSGAGRSAALLAERTVENPVGSSVGSSVDAGASAMIDAPSRDGTTASTAMRQNAMPIAAARLRPHAALLDTEGRAAEWPLADVRVAVAWPGGVREETVLAQPAHDARLTVGDLTVVIGPDAAGGGAAAALDAVHRSLFGPAIAPSSAVGRAPIVLVQRAGRRVELKVAPRLARIEAPLVGAAAMAVPSAPGTVLAVRWGNGDAAVQPADPAGILHLDRLAAAAQRAPAQRSPALRPAVASPDAGLHDTSATGALDRDAPMTTDSALQLPAGLDFVVVRADDLLVVGFTFVNLHLVPGTNPGDPRRLAPISPTALRRIIVHLPPQSMADYAKDEVGDNVPQADPPAIPSALSGPSRLAFDVPASRFPTGFDFTLANLLGWAAWDPAPRVDIPNQVNQPGSGETAIEVPYRITLAPNDAARMGWKHSVVPVERFGRTELWHTRLYRRALPGDITSGPSDPEATRPDLRAIWSPDHAKGVGASAVRFWSLSEADRRDIVQVSEIGGTPVECDRLYLSAMGAWLDVDFVAGPNNPTSLESWTHRASMGRDTWVRIVRKGFLLPWGNAASKVTIVERKFQTAAGGRHVATLRAREYIVIREPEKAFTARDLPFQRIRITTRITPPLAPQAERAKLGALDAAQAFWIQTGTGADRRDVPFNLIGTDRDGEPIDLDMPLGWIDAAYAALAGNAAAAANAYTSDNPRRARPAGGQKVAFAPSSGGGSDPAFETAMLRFAAREVGGVLGPLLDEASVRLAQLQQLAKDEAPTAIRYFSGYVANGFGAANAGEVFAELVDAVGLDFGAKGLGDMAGGLAAPALDIRGLSRKLGLGGGDLATLAGGTFDPASFLGGGARVLGHDVLQQIVKLASFTTGDGSRAPKLATRLDAPTQRILTTLDWSPDVQDFPPFAFDRGGTTEFTLHAELATALAGGASTFASRGELTHFAVDLPIVEVRFSKLVFSAATGQSPKVDPDLDDVLFKGPLEFIAKLQDLLSSGPLGTGPKIELKPTGISASFSIGLPAVAVGVMSLENLRLNTGLDLPFTGDPLRVRFGFCERQSPFVLTVSLFGGGGFVGIALGPEGVVLLEASFEFGAQVSLNIGVASGSAGVMAGIYFKLELGDAELTGYLRCWGRLSILGLIKLSLEFYLSFTYYFPTKSAKGIAELTVKIEILFFSKSFTLRVEREFKGGGGGDDFLLAGAKSTALSPALSPARTFAASPRLAFADLISAVEWDAYCDTFV